MKDGPTRRCLGCHMRLEQPPRPPGELALCLECGAVMITDDDLNVRGMTEEEMNRVCNSRVVMWCLSRLLPVVQLIPKEGSLQ